MSKAFTSSGRVNSSCSRQLALGAPAQQGHIVEDGLGEIALRLQILIGGIAVALGHLVLQRPA